LPIDTPTTYFIDPDGFIQDMVLGVIYQPWIAVNLAAVEK